jgi:hypothetical protein
LGTRPTPPLGEKIKGVILSDEQGYYCDGTRLKADPKVFSKGRKQERRSGTFFLALV